MGVPNAALNKSPAVAPAAILLLLLLVVVVLRSMLPYQCGINEFVNDGEHAEESDKESEEESAEFNSNVLLVVLEMLE